METEDEPTGPSPRTWTFLIAAAWMCLGAWTLTSDSTALGVGQVLLGLCFLVTAFGPQRERRTWWSRRR